MIGDIFGILSQCALGSGCGAKSADAEWEHLDDDLVPFIVVSTIK